MEQTITFEKKLYLQKLSGVCLRLLFDNISLSKMRITVTSYTFKYIKYTGV